MNKYIHDESSCMTWWGCDPCIAMCGVQASHTWVCGVGCEGFAPHTANSRLPIPRCVSLHHGGRYRGQLVRDEESCVITYHNESPCVTHGGVEISCTLSCWKCLRHCMASHSVVQGHRLFYRSLCTYPQVSRIRQDLQRSRKFVKIRGIWKEKVCMHGSFW